MVPLGRYRVRWRRHALAAQRALVAIPGAEVPWETELAWLSSELSHVIRELVIGYPATGYRFTLQEPAVHHLVPISAQLAAISLCG